MKESLVEVSPSMLMRLNERAAAWATRCCSASRETAASVEMNPSMVAMSGRIMPAPLAIPVTVTPRLSSRARCDRALGTVSVVMIVSAARAQLSSHRSATHAGRPATMRSSGSGSMITPVENGSTCRESQPRRFAAARLCASEPLFPGAGVGVSGVDDECPERPAGGEVLLRHLHRRGAKAVLREYARHPRPFREGHEKQIFAPGFSDPRLGDAQLHALDGKEILRFRRT